VGKGKKKSSNDKEQRGVNIMKGLEGGEGKKKMQGEKGFREGT